MKDKNNYIRRFFASLMKAAQKFTVKDDAAHKLPNVNPVANNPPAFRTAEYFSERASRGDPERLRKLLSRPGGMLPRADDEIPPS